MYLPQIPSYQICITMSFTTVAFGYPSVVPTDQPAVIIENYCWGVTVPNLSHCWTYYSRCDKGAAVALLALESKVRKCFRLAAYVSVSTRKVLATLMSVVFPPRHKTSTGPPFT